MGNRGWTARQLTRVALRQGSLLIISWCVMTLTHELGHIVCGWACGGRLTAFDLRPWHLPYSIFQPDPLPLVTLWGGPLLGVAVPLAIAWLVGRQWAWFTAYFCVLANGVYLAAAWLSGQNHLDTTELLRHGAHPMTIMLYCALTIPYGYIGMRHHIRIALSPSAAADRRTEAQHK